MANDNGNDAGDRDDAEGASGVRRLTTPPDEVRAPRLAFPVVGIGASAGGLEAYSEFLQAASADAGMAYVLVQHLPPDRESLLVELLARQTKMPVVQVADGDVVVPNHVYIIRPGNTLTIKEGHLWLGPALAARGHGRPIDDFFRSLAEEQQQRAVAVVFSGMGSNGSAGAQAIKAVGGLVIAQEPDSAKYPSMPRSLIDGHLADLILRPAEVPEALVKYAGQPYVAADGGGTATPRDEQALGDVLAVLRTRTRHDFSGYRKPTLFRRVRRRMGLCQIGTLAEYVRTLRQTPAEVTALADDLLIHVTGFFRDPEAWAVLRERVIDPLVLERADGTELRCWVSACATGEEAYTLAMVLVEAAEAHDKHFEIKVFATDMAERALGSARTGVFPNGIESEVSPERLARFFDKDDSFYRVKRELRELVIFAPQNILHDPPFSRLDIATCRNLLIYLEPETQRRVLALLHFGLREGGALLLGSSESAAPAEGDFEPIDKRHRLFRRVGPTRSGNLDLPVLTAPREAGPVAAAPLARPAAPVVGQLASRALLERFTPPAVVVDAVGQVVHVHGDTGHYLKLAPGGASLDLMALASDQVRGAVRTALRRASDSGAAASIRDGLIDTPYGRRRVEVGATPLGPRGGSPLYLVTFRDYPEMSAPPPLTDDDATAAVRLTDELQRTRNELQGALEEMQSSNEELKASHEEATSLNEELQSTNEELETSKEEMQSLNEELVTVNAQLQAKMGELEGTANDLGSLLTSTDIAVLFLDLRFRIRRFTPAVKDLLDLIPSDVGRPFVDLRRKFADPELMSDAQAVLDRLIPVERAIESESGRAYLRRVLPYRTQDNRIDGVVIAFVNVTEQRQADAALRESEAKYHTLFESMDEAYAVVEVIADDSGRWTDFLYVQVNPAFVRHTGMDDPVGKTAKQILGTPNPRWAEIYGKVAETGESIRLEESELTLGHVYDLNIFRVGGSGSRRVAVLFTNITARKQAEAALKAVADRDAFLVRLTDALRPLADPVAIQAEAARVLGEHLGAARVHYAEATDDGAYAVVHADYHRDLPGVAGRHRLDDFGRTIVDELRAGRTLAIGDVRTDPRLTAAEQRDITSLGSIAATLNVPLHKGDRTVAFLAVHHAAAHPWTKDEVTLVEQTAERTWAAVERAKAEAALRASEQRLSLALATAEMGTFVWFPQEDRGEPDARMLALFGLPADGRLNLADALAALIHPADRAGYAAAVSRALDPTGPGELRVDIRVTRPDGIERWLAITARVEFAGDPPRAARMPGVATDVTERKRDEERQAYLLKLSDALRPLSDAVAIEVEATRVLGEHLGADRVLYAEAEPDEDHILIHRDFTAAGQTSIAGRQKLSAFGAHWLEGYRAGRTLATADFPDIDGSLSAAFEAIGVGACVGVPVNKGGKFVGVLIVHSAKPREWTALEVGLIEDTAERTWAAVERAKAEEALRASEERRAFQLRLSDALRPLADPIAVQVAACRLLGERLGVDRSYFVELDEDAGCAEVRQDYLRGDSPSLAGRYRIADFGWVIPPLRRGELLVIPDVGSSPLVPPADREMMAAVQIAAHVNAPLVKAGRLVGALCVTASAPRAWTVDEAELVRETGERIWAAIERARAEAALRKSEARLRAVAANLPNGAAFLVGRDLRYSLAEGRALVVAGFTSADFEGKTLAQALPADLAVQYEPHYRQALAGEPFRVEHAAHGRRFVTHGEPLRDDAGQVTGVLAVSYDITDLRLAEDRLRLALRAARMGIWTLDGVTGTQMRDANLNELLGLDPVETTQPFAEFLGHIHADDRDPVSTAFADSLRDGRPLNVEFRIVRPDGAVRWLRDQGDVFGDAAARRRHMAGACVDVTERRVAEDAVRAGEERLRLILASATDYAIFTVAADRTVTSWSSGAAATFGYSEAEILGRPMDVLFTPEDQAAGMPERECETARQAGRANDERWHLRQDGSRFYASGVLTRLDSGEYVKVARDLTERKRTEDQLRDAHGRLEARVSERTAQLAAAVRSLEAEIARRQELSLRLSNAQEEERKRVSRDLHDTVGQTHVALTLALAATAKSITSCDEAAGQLAYAGQLAESMGRELHDVAMRLRPTTLDDLGLAVALAGLVRTWSGQQRTQIDLQADLDGRLPNEVETALYRLVQEALTNVARHAHATTVSVVVTRESGAVTTVVEDDGVGFDPASAGADRLGLRGMHERVTLIGGELVVESSPGAGTTIIARVPLHESRQS